MRRRAPDPNRNPGVRPVKRVELSSRHPLLRLIVVIVLLLIGVGAITFAVNAWLNSGTGWQEIKVSSVESCPESGDFTLLCDLGNKGGEARRKKKALTELYTAALSRAAALFDAENDHDGKSDLYRLNHSVGQEITVSDEFYRALEIALADGRRDLFLGPVAYRYEVLFSITENDLLAAENDPQKNAALDDVVRRTVAFAKDPYDVSLSLNGEGRVLLSVSSDYRAFAEENGIEEFIGFFRLKNALIVDLVSDELNAEEGCPEGVLTSYDGFARGIGSSEGYDFPVYDDVGNRVARVAVLSGSSPRATASFRRFPITAYEETFRCYRYADGELRMGDLDPTDGKLKAAAKGLTLYSTEKSCAELYLAGVSVYAADELNTAALAALPASGVQYICLAGEKIRYSDTTLTTTEQAYPDYVITPAN